MDQLERVVIYGGAFISLGTAEDAPWLKNTPQLLGEACWTLLTDNTWTALPHMVTRLIRLPARPR